MRVASDVRQCHPQTAASGPVYCTVYERLPGFMEIAEAELAALGGGYSPEAGVWLSKAPIRWPTCGYARAAGQQLAAAATLEQLEAEVRALGLSAPSFCIETICLPHRRKGSTAAKARLSACIEGRVSFDHPRMRLLLVMAPLGLRLLVRDDPRPFENSWLAARHKPYNYKVATPVRLAKALLNLTLRPGDTVLDPFCGSGTIPLLAAWAGHRAFGSDVSDACVAGARQNLAHFGLEATVIRADARTARQAAHCIVSNLPYGLHCHLAAGALPAVLRNLSRLAPRLTLVTPERIDDALRDEGYEVQQMIPVDADRLARTVYVARFHPTR